MATPKAQEARDILKVLASMGWDKLTYKEKQFIVKVLLMVRDGYLVRNEQA